MTTAVVGLPPKITYDGWLNRQIGRCDWKIQNEI